MQSTLNAGPSTRGGPMTIGQGPTAVAGARRSGHAGGRRPTSDGPLADGIEELIGATSVLRSELDAHEATCRKVLDEVRVDHEITGVLPEVQADTWRSAVTEATASFEASCHWVRLLPGGHRGGGGPLHR